MSPTVQITENPENVPLCSAHASSSGAFAATQHDPAAPPRRAVSLKTKLAAGAGMIGLVALLSSALTVVGMDRVGDRIAASLQAERRLARYAVLSTEASTFLVVAAEAIQSGLPPEARAARLSPAAADLDQTFDLMRADLAAAVDEAAALGLAEQSRRASQGIAIARMEALFRTARAGLASDTRDRERLQGVLNGFAHAFDPLLNEAVGDEIRTRDAILTRIAALRRSLTGLALAVAALAALMVGGFYLGLLRPQFDRLDRVRQATRRIGAGDFAPDLPERTADEIGQLFAETNRAATALARDRARLNDTIRARTEDLRAANAALARIDADRRRFFADISHELRTPLTVILMEAELGLKGAAPQDAFATIQARAQRLSRRIDDLLRVARSESGRIELCPEPMDLRIALAEALAETRAELEAAGLEVTVMPGSALRATGDPNWVRQVIAGLARNVLRHAREGGRVAFSVGPEAGYGCVRVVDNGPGIPQKDRARVLERFGRGSAAPPGEGFGIGLALARWVLEQQGGHIAIESPVPDGFRLGTAPGTLVGAYVPLVD